jgi:hypothetical protein
MELIPVIEFEANRFTEKEYEYPQKSREQDPEGWELYWRRSLADSGITDIDSLSGSGFVPIENLSQDVLRIYLSKWLVNLEEDYSLEYVSPIIGGYVLKSLNDVLLWPQCCGDLSNITEWEKVLNCKSSQWIEIWVGHPCVSARFENNLLFISGLHEPGELPKGVLCSFESFNLQTSISSAKRILATFHSSVSVLLASSFRFPHNKEIADILVYGIYN